MIFSQLENSKLQWQNSSTLAFLSPTCVALYMKMYSKPSPILFPIPRKRCLSLPKVIGTHDSTSCSFLWDLHPQLSSLQIFSSHSFHSSDMPISSPPILSWLLYGVVSLRCLLALWVLSVGSGVRQPWVGVFILILVLSHIA